MRSRTLASTFPCSVSESVCHQLSNSSAYSTSHPTTDYRCNSPSFDLVDCTYRSLHLKLFRSLVFFLIAPALTFAASVTTTAQCGGTVVISSSTSSCLVNSPNYESSTSSASYGVAGNVVSFGVATSSLARYSPVILSSAAEALGSIQIVDTVVTSGPVRPGYLVITQNLEALLWNSDDGNEDSISYSFGTISGGCYGNYILFPNCYGPGTSVNGSNKISIQLGADLTLSAKADSGSYQSTGFGSGRLGEASGSVTFLFFETDGVTPVNVFSVAPEPGTWWMMAGSLISLAVWKRKW
jgi:hypothetical protein